MTYEVPLLVRKQEWTQAQSIFHSSFLIGENLSGCEGRKGREIQPFGYFG